MADLIINTPGVFAYAIPQETEEDEEEGIEYIYSVVPPAEGRAFLDDVDDEEAES